MHFQRDLSASLSGLLFRLVNHVELVNEYGLLFNGLLGYLDGLVSLQVLGMARWASGLSKLSHYYGNLRGGTCLHVSACMLKCMNIDEGNRSYGVD